MDEHSLLLHPLAPSFAPGEAPLRAALEGVGLLGPALADLGPRLYRPGPAFLQRMVFLGCSPVVALGEPGATGDSFCRIELPPVADGPRLISGSNVRQPRCPACKRPVEGWRELLPAWSDAPLAPWACGACNAATSAAQLRWRQSAAVARAHVVVWGVFEGEAVPDEVLLGALAALGGGPWDHFYAKMPAR